jgi:hypothetical protein
MVVKIIQTVLTWSSAMMNFTNRSRKTFAENGVRFPEPGRDSDGASLLAFELGS